MNTKDCDRVDSHMADGRVPLWWRRRIESLYAGMCRVDSRIRLLAVEPQKGAATAEYAVVLVAATGFGALLVSILKSSAVKTLLMNIIKKALQL